MEKGFRLVRCPNCPTTLRLKISEKQYGKTLVVTCTKCREKFTVTIPVPAQDEPPRHGRRNLIEDLFGGAFGDLFKTDKKPN